MNLVKREGKIPSRQKGDCTEGQFGRKQHIRNWEDAMAEVEHKEHSLCTGLKK